MNKRRRYKAKARRVVRALEAAIVGIVTARRLCDCPSVVVDGIRGYCSHENDTVTALILKLVDRHA